MNLPGDKPFAVINCGELVTLAGPPRPRIRGEMKELSILRNAAMLVREGRIERIGSQTEIASGITSDYQIVDAGGRSVLPGFVDAHTHPVFGGTRVDEYELRAGGATYEEIAASGGGIRSTVRKTRAASEDELFDQALRRSWWFTRVGTTTIEAKSGYGLTLESELRMLRVIRRLSMEGNLGVVPTFLGAHEVPDEFRGRTKDYVELVIGEMLPAVARCKLAEYCDVFCEPSIFDSGATLRILAAARQLGLGVRVHADQLSRSGAAEVAAEAGAATADHLEQI